MIKCPSCGFHNSQDRERCLKCSAALKSTLVPDGSAVADKAAPRVDLRTAFNRLRERAAAAVQGDLPVNVPHRFPWTAAHLAILFGAGQWYNYQPRKALVFAVIQLALLGVFVFTFFKWWNDWVALVVVLWVFFAMAEAYSVAVKINGDYWRWRNLFALWSALIFYVATFLFVGQLFGSGFFYITTVRGRGLSPSLEPGDTLFVLAWPFYRPLLRPGSLVYYDPPRFQYFRPGTVSTDTYIANERNSFGVISARGGDTMSWDPGGEIVVNGEPLPPHRLPIDPNGTPGAYTVTVPQDEYGILFTHRVIEQGMLSFLGGSYNAAIPNPREATRGGFGILEYENAVTVPPEEIYGIVLFRFHPPPRRAWFGLGGGIWADYPDGYPEVAAPAEDAAPSPQEAAPES